MSERVETRLRSAEFVQKLHEIRLFCGEMAKNVNIISFLSPCECVLCVVVDERWVLKALTRLSFGNYFHSADSFMQYLCNALRVMLCGRCINKFAATLAGRIAANASMWFCVAELLNDLGGQATRV